MRRQRRSSRRSPKASASKRPSRASHQYPGRRRRGTSGPNWKLISAITAGIIMLALVILVGTRALTGSEPEPTATVTTVVAITTPTETSTTIITPGLALAATPLPLDNHLPDWEQFMYDLVNQDREGNELSQLAWDATAATAGRAHAQDMAENGYMSHWNLAGQGPDHRYSQAGGPHVAQENVYMYWFGYDDGRPAPILDWEQLVREAEAALMDSPGHRANILNPDHTHVGIGMAYNPTTGNVCIAQEFVNYYVNTEALPSSARLGETLSVRGQLLPGATDPLVNLAYEPFPETMSSDELATTSTYVSPAEICSVPPVSVAQDTFHAEVMLDCEGRAGLYHVRIWVKVAGREVPATDVVIEVE